MSGTSTDMRTDMYTDMRMDMCTDKCADIQYTHMGIDMTMIIEILTAQMVQARVQCVQTCA